MSGVLVQIRDVDPSVRDRLKARAADEGVSLNTLLKRLLGQAAQVPSRAEVLRRISERGDLLPPTAPVTTNLIREMRDDRDEELFRRTAAPDQGR